MNIITPTLPAFLMPRFVNHTIEDMHGIEWVQRDAPRMESWMALSNTDYSYGEEGFARTYKSVDMPYSVKHIMTKMNKQFDLDYNCCMANLYQTDRQSLGYHADDSESMDPDHPIASASFGAEREIHFRPIGQKGPATHKFSLPNGSVCVMLGGMQQQWHHKIPKHSAPCSARISLTFRRLLPHA